MSDKDTVDNEPSTNAVEFTRRVALVRLVPRLLGAALSGAGLVLGWWGFFLLFPELPFSLVEPEVSGSSCEAARVLCELAGAATGALLGLLLTTTLVLSLSLPIGWGLLWLLRVRPALPTALLGPVLAWLVGSMADRLFSITGGAAPVWLACWVALGYSTASFVTAETVPRYRRLAVLAALVVIWVMHRSLTSA